MSFVTADVAKAVGDILTPAGYTISMEGENKDMDESRGELAGAFGIALIAVYLLLVTQYRLSKGIRSRTQGGHFRIRGCPVSADYDDVLVHDRRHGPAGNGTRPRGGTVLAFGGGGYRRHDRVHLFNDDRNSRSVRYNRRLSGKNRYSPIILISTLLRRRPSNSP